MRISIRAPPFALVFWDPSSRILVPDQQFQIDAAAMHAVIHSIFTSIHRGFGCTASERLFRHPHDARTAEHQARMSHSLLVAPLHRLHGTTLMHRIRESRTCDCERLSGHQAHFLCGCFGVRISSSPSPSSLPFQIQFAAVVSRGSTAQSTFGRAAPKRNGCAFRTDATARASRSMRPNKLDKWSSTGNMQTLSMTRASFMF